MKGVVLSLAVLVALSYATPARAFTLGLPSLAPVPEHTKHKVIPIVATASRGTALQLAASLQHQLRRLGYTCQVSYEGVLTDRPDTTGQTARLHWFFVLVPWDVNTTQINAVLSQVLSQQVIPVTQVSVLPTSY